MDWRTDKQLFEDIFSNQRAIADQKSYRASREEAFARDRAVGRGHLVLNPDLKVIDPMDCEGMIIRKDNKEYRVVVDPAMKGMKDKDTGEVKAGFWLEPSPPFTYQVLPVTDFSQSLHNQHALMAKSVVNRVEPMDIPTSELFKEETEHMNVFSADVIMASQEKASLVDEIIKAAWPKLVDAWLMYYQRMERLDRSVPHAPSGRTQSVIPRSHWDTSEIKRRRREVRGQLDEMLLNIPSQVRLDTQQEALDIHMKELEWCDCTSCKEAR